MPEGVIPNEPLEWFKEGWRILHYEDVCCRLGWRGLRRHRQDSRTSTDGSKNGFLTHIYHGSHSASLRSSNALAFVAIDVL
jgi:hypothetical protein